MPIPQAALDLENRNLGVDFEPTLAKAFEILNGQWQTGDRDRELGLHLMFLSWYGIIEPTHITGFPDTIENDIQLNRMFEEVHEYFEPQIQGDSEMLYAFGLAAHMFWYMLEDSAKWETIAAKYQKAYRTLTPDGIDVAVFKDRGAYGNYYAMQSESGEGY